MFDSQSTLIYSETHSFIRIYRLSCIRLKFLKINKKKICQIMDLVNLLVFSSSIRTEKNPNLDEVFGLGPIAINATDKQRLNLINDIENSLGISIPCLIIWAFSLIVFYRRTSVVENIATLIAIIDFLFNLAARSSEIDSSFYGYLTYFKHENLAVLSFSRAGKEMCCVFFLSREDEE